ncbi:hypothetical protein [Pseudoalteromonas byunsanensis]|uniref:Uncharacterized protein n=1 Tax=Pseudoalteromonas byunsanensis TaxID=327939 RepID=A0A1S1MWZ5_9GAMM|nr:hypothetical protein [Pseudoalteromonas byunsanensis]OHU93422.1 hypothetical protein BIW53_18850 [Pseudoalteromonas byunsanensis]
MLKNFFVAAFVITLAACKATPYKTPLAEQSLDGPIDVYVMISQQELEADFPVQDSSAVGAQFGLVGALVSIAIDSAANSANTEAAQDPLTIVRNELNSFDFDSLLFETIKTRIQLANQKLGNAYLVHSHAELGEKTEIGNNYMVVAADYRLLMDFRTVKVSANAYIKERLASDKKAENSELYRNLFTVLSEQLPVAEKSEEYIAKQIANAEAEFDALPEAVKSERVYKAKLQRKIKKARLPVPDFEEARLITANAWATTYQGQLKGNLIASIDSLVDLINLDVQDTTDPSTYEPPKSKALTAVHSQVVQELPERKILRITHGMLAGKMCSIPNSTTEKRTCL